jgi:hypothetical protein
VGTSSSHISQISVVDRHGFDADPGPAFHFDGDLDPDPDPATTFAHDEKSIFEKHFLHSSASLLYIVLSFS